MLEVLRKNGFAIYPSGLGGYLKLDEGARLVVHKPYFTDEWFAYLKLRSGDTAGHPVAEEDVPRLVALYAPAGSNP